ncbi:hypothetical protein [uncultured Roseobacter sp.]|uniref:hypothetical protein n=1 Tax=uncultured Roseobacter sp. TaxID=114847 RepID=UPI00260AFB1B|nr:hypothetical protein [uncultured Roseobacter sp.]
MTVFVKLLTTVIPAVLPFVSPTHAQHIVLDHGSSARVAFSFHAAEGVGATLVQDGSLLIVEGTMGPETWVSTRRMFRESQDWRAFQSIELSLRVEKGVGLTPRVTILDITPTGGEEFYWIDLEEIKAPGSYTACVAISSAKLGYGVGSATTMLSFTLRRLLVSKSIYSTLTRKRRARCA